MIETLTFETPLSKYLDKQGMTQRAFAEMLSMERGVFTSTTEVNRWSTGAVMPGPGMRVQMERATKGKLPRKAWDRLV